MNRATNVKSQPVDEFPPYISMYSMRSILSSFGNTDFKATSEGLDLINFFLDQFLYLIVTNPVSGEINVNSMRIKVSLEKMFPNSALVQNLIEYAGYGIITNNSQPSRYGPGSGVSVKSSSVVDAQSKQGDNRIVRMRSGDERENELLKENPNLAVSNNMFSSWLGMSIKSNNVIEKDSMKGIYSPKAVYEALRSMSIHYGNITRKVGNDNINKKWKPTKVDKQLISQATAIYVSRILEHIAQAITMYAVYHLNSTKTDILDEQVNQSDPTILHMQSMFTNQQASLLLDRELVLHCILSDPFLSEISKEIGFKQMVEKQLSRSFRTGVVPTYYPKPVSKGSTHSNSSANPKVEFKKPNLANQSTIAITVTEVPTVSSMSSTDSLATIKKVASNTNMLAMVGDSQASTPSLTPDSMTSDIISEENVAMDHNSSPFTLAQRIKSQFKIKMYGTSQPPRWKHMLTSKNSNSAVGPTTPSLCQTMRDIQMPIGSGFPATYLTTTNVHTVKSNSYISDNTITVTNTEHQKSTVDNSLGLETENPIDCKVQVPPRTSLNTQRSSFNHDFDVENLEFDRLLSSQTTHKISLTPSNVRFSNHFLV